MTTDIEPGALARRRPTDAGTPGQGARRWWSGVAALILAGLFGQAVLAGAMLSGTAWARGVHALGSAILIVSAFAAGLIALVSLRRTANGAKLGLVLLGLGAALVVQTALGRLSAQGAGLLWAHVPLGVALVGLGAQAMATARRLGRA